MQNLYFNLIDFAEEINLEANTFSGVGTTKQILPGMLNHLTEHSYIHRRFNNAWVTINAFSGSTSYKYDLFDFIEKLS